MIRIVLVCSAGMSTSLLVTKMRDAAKNHGIEADIAAIPEVEIKSRTQGTDIFLLGPQVRFLLSKMKQELTPLGIAVAVIDGLSYGTMNGEAVLKQAMELIANK